MHSVELKKITKIFSTLTANDRVDLKVNKGEIHSLLGENGAGKTTLMKILYGMYQPDGGEIYINGEKQKIVNPTKAISLGIAMVHQHFMLVDPLTVAENIVLGYEPQKGIFFNRQQAEQEVKELSERFGLKVDVRAKIEELPVGSKQRVEILKALYRKAEILILDEPTAVLTPLEVDELFAVLERLKRDGKTIIIITHKLKETMAIADRVTVLRAGKVIATVNKNDTNPEQLAEMMVGRKISFEVQKKKVDQEELLLELKEGTLSKAKVKVLDQVNLQLKRGEILGLAGVEGNGQTEIIEVLTGLLKLDQGQLILKGQEITSFSPSQMLEAGIGHIPEDRNKRGLVGQFSIKENLILGYHKRSLFSDRGLLKEEKIKQFASRIAEEFDVRTVSNELPVSALSGGNQQKVVIGRVLAENPDVIIAAQPTRGVDIGAIEYIHHKLLEMRAAGKAILLISADLDEIKKLSDRIAVIYEGKIVAINDADRFSEYDLGKLMTGGIIDNQFKEGEKDVKKVREHYKII